MGQHLTELSGRRALWCAGAMWSMAVTVRADDADRATRALHAVLAPDAILAGTETDGEVTLYLTVRDREQAGWAKDALAGIRILATDLRDVTPRRHSPMGHRRSGGTVIG
ncbi:hypothetical protein [Nonomuraea rosea]